MESIDGPILGSAPSGPAPVTDIGVRISTDISTQISMVIPLINTDITNQTVMLASAISMDISMSKNNLSSAVSFNLGNRHVM